MTCQLSFFAMYTAAIGTARFLLGSPPLGHTTFKNVFYLLSVFKLHSPWTLYVTDRQMLGGVWAVRLLSLHCLFTVALATGITVLFRRSQRYSSCGEWCLSLGGWFPAEWSLLRILRYTKNIPWYYSGPLFPRTLKQ